MTTANDSISRRDALRIAEGYVADFYNRQDVMREINAIPASAPPAVESAQETSPALADAYADDVLDALWKLEGNEGAAYKIALAFHDKLEGTSATPPPSPASVDDAVYTALHAWRWSAYPSTNCAFPDCTCSRNHMCESAMPSFTPSKNYRALSLPAPVQVGETTSRPTIPIKVVIEMVQRVRDATGLGGYTKNGACEEIISILRAVERDAKRIEQRAAALAEGE